jgi:putative membrane protein
MWGMHDGMGWWMVFGGLWMVLFWGAVIWLVVWGVGRATSGTGGRTSEQEAPVEIAKRRYARGEISREEFEQLRRDLA